MHPRRFPARLLLAVGILGTVLATGCSSAADTASPPETDPVLASHGLEGKDARALIEVLDATPVAERSTDFMAQIRPDTLVISDASGAEASLDLPEDEFYVSIAPFVTQTHDCFLHSLTTCRGELANEDIDVEVIDDSGAVLVEETMTTFDNGFVGLWLPRDINATITLEMDGRTVTDTISTGSDDPTCVTTLQLA